MNAEDLMIGDWVAYVRPKGDIEWSKVHLQTLVNMGKSEYLCNHLLPIPLTQEILEKNGFIYHPLFNESKEEEPRYAFFLPRRDKRAGEDYIILSPQEEWNNDCKWGIDIEIMGHTYIQHELNYIHELQHALRLCGIEKEIEL